MDKTKKGTTTLGLVCKNGIVLAADKRASLGHLAFDRVEKIHEITPNIGLTIAGSVGDAHMLRKFLISRMELYRINKEQEPTVEVASAFLSNVVYSGSKNFFPYMTMFIIGGKGKDGWKMFSMDPSGASESSSYVTTGSGMELALGVLEEHFKKGLSVEEGIKLALKAMTSAIRRDVFTGEGVDVAVIDSKGFRKVEYKKFKDVLRDE